MPRITFRFTGSLTLGLLCATFYTQAQAQVASVPSSVEPGRLEQRFQPDARPQLQKGAIIKQEEPAIATDANDQVAFTLKDVRVTGASVFSSAELRGMFADQIGKEVTLSGLRGIAAKVTTQYRNAGYILTRAIVPPQRIQEGIVVIDVTEGFIDQVVFQGAEKQSQELMEAYAAKIKASKPLKNSDLERYLLLLDDLTGVNARGVLSASPTARGGSILTIALDHKTIEGELTVDNRNSKYLGPWEAGLMVSANSALGLSEQLRARVLSSLDFQELHFYEGTYQQPIGAEGTTVRVQGSFTDTNPGSTLSVFDIEGKSTSFSVQAQHPFKRSRQENVYGGAGFRYRDANTDVLSTELYDDHIRALFANVAYDTLDGLDGVNRVDAEVTQGMGSLGANDAGDLISRSNGENVFTKLNLQATRLQPLSDAVSWFVGVSGQASTDPLLASEEFTVGGMNFGSAYDPAEISGDHGFAARTELRYSDNLPETYGSIYQLYVFYDGGKVYNKDALLSEQKSESLTSAGLGVRASLAYDLYATAEIAKPLTRDVAAQGDDDLRGFASLTYSF